jgi:hypothetical protein
VSDHNRDESGNTGSSSDPDNIDEVHAIDLDVNLRVPGLTMEMVVQHILKRCRSGQEKRLKYIIYNRRIWEGANGWAQESYGGDNPHTQHAHFSGKYGSGTAAQGNPEANTSSWGLEELLEGLDMPLDTTDLNNIKAKVAELFATGQQPGQSDPTVLTSNAGQAIWNQGVPDGVGGKAYAWAVLQRTRADLVAATAGDAARDAALATAIDGVRGVCETLLTVIQSGGGDVDVAAILTKLDEVQAAAVDAAGAAANDVLNKIRAAQQAEADAYEAAQE